MLNLKSIETNEGRPKKFAYLIEPSGDIRSDEQLYAAVHKNGRAVLREFEGATFKASKLVELTPTAFESQWQGD